ncbi:amidohydrolase family protein [Microvirga sp. G4-2]|uniref:amidohydrolase family protein n=1 Tax=Microvirga sp. G4-2 TaxID=3434467 RepID=UPI004044E4C5
MRIDSHQHFWRVSRGDYFWMSPDVEVLYRDYGPEDLQPLLARHDIDRTILVQAAPSVAETEFMLEIAEAAPFVAGVVGWVEFSDPDAAQTIERLAADPLTVGFRPMVQDIPDDDWLLRPDLAVAFRTLVEQRLVFDALVLPRHLSRALVVADRYADLSIVIDHGAKPFIREGLLDPWRADMAALAARPNIVCKLSGLVTEARADWSVDDLRPYVDHLLTVFGPERLLWGSDWPVVNLAGGYDRWREAALELLASLSDTEKAAILGGNAARTYLRDRGRR